MPHRETFRKVEENVGGREKTLPQPPIVEERRERRFRLSFIGGGEGKGAYLHNERGEGTSPYRTRKRGEKKKASVKEKERKPSTSFGRMSSSSKSHALNAEKEGN